MLRTFCFLLFLPLCFAFVHGQTPISGIINTYAKVTAITPASCTHDLTVDAATGFAAGDKVLIIQMKGATINTTISASYGDVTALNDAGNYEYAFIGSIAGNVITLQSALLRSYTVSGYVQLVRVPQYTDANVTATLTCPAWSATTGTGGILALDVSGTLFMNGNIDVSGKGFRGGLVSIDKAQYTPLFCSNSNYVHPISGSSAGNGGEKGEGIVNWIAVQEGGRAHLANGGGGGNIQNAGGGGGGNYEAGGKGGGTNTGGGCGPNDYGGFGGFALTTFATGQDRVFLGGGGGGGQQNNTEGSSGKNGGGIVIINAGTLTNNGIFQIISNGDNNITPPGGDGAGGGGAGGSVLLNVNNYSNPVTVSAKGGKGGNVNSFDQTRCFGPGGGGAGGVVWFSQNSTPINVTVSLTAGSNGINTVNNFCASNPAYFATSGNPGTELYNLTFPVAPAGFSFTTASVDPKCNNGTDGTITVTPSPGATNLYEYFINGTSQGNNNVFSGLAAGSYNIKVEDASNCGQTQTVILNNPTVVSGSVSTQVNPDCSPGAVGSFTVTGSGGAGGSYTYSIDNGTNFQSNGSFSGLISGAYTVIVKDSKGCTANVPITLGIISDLTITVSSKTDPTCSGGSNGSVTVSGSLGAGSYTYSTDNITFGASATFNGLSGGTKTFYVKDAANCVASVQATLTAPAALSLSVSNQINPNCNGATNGSFTIGATGGTGTKQYSLDGGTTQQASSTFSGKVAGSYTVTVTDANSCTATIAVTLTQPLAINIVTGNLTNVLCNGGNNGSVSASATGGTGTFTFTSSPTATYSAGAFIGLTAQTYTITATDGANCTTTTSITITQPAALSATVASSVQPTCVGANGSVTVSATGGAGGYTYSANGGTFGSSNILSGLSGGAGSIVVKDANGCTFTLGYTLTSPSAPTASISSQTNISCFGGNNGAVTVVGTGGAGAPFTYKLGAITNSTGSFSGLNGGTYIVEVRDANNCLFNQTVTITEPAALSGNVVSTTSVLCNGGTTGSVILGATGGTQPYTYSADGTNFQNPATFNGLGAGAYNYTVKDANGCQKIITFSISEPSLLVPTISNQINVACNGQSTGAVTVSATGGIQPYSYSIDNGTNYVTSSTFSGLSAGAVTVLVKDANGCVKPVSATITEPSALVLNLVSKQDVTCNGANDGQIIVNATGGNGTISYQLNSAPIQPSGTFTGLSAATYTLKAIDQNGCSQTISVTLTESAGITASVSAQTNVSCNGAANGSITVTASGGSGTLTYKLNGVVKASNVFTGLSGGAYAIDISDANNCVVTLTATLNEPAAIALSTASTTNVNCFGGSTGAFTISATGGTGAFTYVVAGVGSQSNGTFSGLTAQTYNVTVTDGNGCTATTTVALTQPNPFGTTLSNVQDQPCVGGSNGAATVTASGGTAPYSFVLNGGLQTISNPSAATFSGLGQGNYSVVTTDAKGCTDTETFSILQPVNTITLIVTNQTNINCFGANNGAVTLTPFGGTSPYNVSVNGGAFAPTTSFTGLAPGTYNYILKDANNCTATASVSITQPNVLSATIQATPITCNGANDGKLVCAVTGGVQSYSYLWGGGQTTQTVTGLGAGSYTVTVTDQNGCTATASSTLIEPASMNITLQSSSVLCAGGSTGQIKANPTGGTAPYAYVWSNGQNFQTATGLVAGTYTVTVTDSKGCTATASGDVTQPDSLNGTIAVTDVNCTNANSGAADLTVIGGTAPFTFQWTGGATTEDLTNVQSGNYFVVITDAKGCQKILPAQIKNLSLLTATVTSSNVSCNGGADGTAFVATTGGVQPLTYAWTNGGGFLPNANNLQAGTYVVTVTDQFGCSVTASATITEPAAIVLNETVDSISCSGQVDGKIALNVSGGTAPYTYLWSNGKTTSGIDNLTAGVYDVTVTDNKNCTATGSFTITEPALLNPTAVATDAQCNASADGSIDLTVAGGTAPYTFVWSNGKTTEDLSGLTAGAYSVVVTDKRGCSQAVSVNVASPLPIVLTTNQINVTCNAAADAAATADATGGAGGFTYAWSGGQTGAIATPLAPGVYVVTATDANNCTATASVTITQPNVLAVSLVSQTNILCNADSTGKIDISVSGGTAPYAYVWTNGKTTQDLTNLKAGIYAVVVTDSKSCTAAFTVTLTEPNKLTATHSVTDLLCNGAANGAIDLTVSGGVSPYTYLWSNGATTQDLSGIGGGLYKVTIKDANGCTLKDSATVVEPTAVAVSVASTNVTCFNAADGTITLNATGGTQPYNVLWNNGATGLTLSGLAPGVYGYFLTDANGCGSLFANITITQPTELHTVSAATNPLCFGAKNGYILVNPAGGTAPYVVKRDGVVQTVNFCDTLVAGTYSYNITDAKGCTKDTTITLVDPQALVVSGVKEDVKCAGTNTGKITLTVAGGTPPYDFIWSDGGPNSATRDSIPFGLYSVAIRDVNHCADTLVFVINEPLPLTSFIAITNSGCDQGANSEVNLTVSGGTQPYLYAWSNGQTVQDATALPAGFAKVTITDANGCVKTDSINIVTPPAITTTYQTTNISCSGGLNSGQINLVASGGQGQFAYQLNGGAFQSTGLFTNLTAGLYTVTVKDTNGCLFLTDITLIELLTITSLDVAVTDVKCFGQNNGAVQVTPVGGVGPFQYTIDGGATFVPTNLFVGLPANSYNITAVDANGCTATNGFTINQPDTLTLSANILDVKCPGEANGKVTLLPSGGTAPYEYAYNNGVYQSNATFDTLSVGAYPFSVRDAKGCTAFGIFEVFQPTPVAFTVVGENAKCNGEATGMIVVSATGGTLPYAFRLNNGALQSDSVFANIPAGQYSVFVQDANGCNIGSQNILIEQPLPLELTVNSKNVTCPNFTDGKIQVAVTGGIAPYQLTINNQPYPVDTGAVTLGVGNFTVKITDANGCTATQTVTLKEDNIPNVTLQIPSVAATGDTITFSATGGESYSWIFPDGLPDEIPGSPVKTVFLLPGTKTVTVVIRVGVCEYTFTGTVVVTGDPVATDEALLANVELYPNPAQDRLFLRRANADQLSVELISPQGQTLISRKVSETTAEFDLSTLAAGVYYVRLSQGKAVVTQKIVVY